MRFPESPIRVPAPVLAGLLASLLAAPAAGQLNANPQIDVRLGALDDGLPLRTWGRVGAFPDGSNGFSMATTSCNVGTVEVPWRQAMNPNHPFIAFLFVREAGGRMEQISDRSNVKHGFFATSNSLCGPCSGVTNGTVLGVGCSDTYATNENGDRFWLGPADEINPWLGSWQPTCSFFDQPPGVQGCDGNRSYFGVEPDAVAHRVTVQDADLLVPGATYYYAAQYVVRAEAEEHRGNNLGSRRFEPSWNGSAWNLDTFGIVPNDLIHGSVLERWSGATVRSEKNGNRDGRLFVAARVTDAGGGLWHYEYAIHNRDNHRGVRRFRLPVSRHAQISGAGFRDVDGDPATDWDFARVDCELRWTTDDNPLLWNTIYNFWFDSDMPPDWSQKAELNPFRDGFGADRLRVVIAAPVDRQAFVYCRGKLNSLGCVPSASAAGNPGTGVGSTFVVTGQNVVPGQPGILVYGTRGRAAQPFHGGTLCLRSPIRRLLPPVFAAPLGPPPCTGRLETDFNDLVRSGRDPALVPGACVGVQWIYRDPRVGDDFGDGLTNAAEFLIGP